MTLVPHCYTGLLWHEDYGMKTRTGRSCPLECEGYEIGEFTLEICVTQPGEGIV